MNIIILSREPENYSTRRLSQAAAARGHEVRVIDHTKCKAVIEHGSPKLLYENEMLSDVDAVIPRIGASVTFFGAAIVRQFEMMDVFVSNLADAIVRSRDKLVTLQYLACKNVNVPKTLFAKHPKGKDVDKLIELAGGTPIIIKLLEGTQGIGVVLADSKKSAKSEIEAFSGLRANVIVQEYIEEAGNSDLRVFVINNKIVAAIKRQGNEDEFRSNIHRGGSSQIVKLSPEEENTALEAVKAVGLSIAGVDMLQSSKGPLVMEVNSSPGLQGIEKVTQIDIAGKVIEYLEGAIAKKNK